MHPGEGARIDGEYHVIYPEDGIVFRGEFFVKNYPYKQADDDVVPSCLAAVPTDVYTYNTAQGSVHSIHALDFGIPCDAPPEIALEEQKKEAEATVAAEKKKAQSELRALKDNEDDAAKGDVYGLLRMGERYRDGEGVEKNLDKARDYLSRAAQAGDLTAKEELETLPKTATAASN